MEHPYQSKKFKKPKGGKKYIPYYDMISGILSFQRNMNGQFYMVQDLKPYGHYTAITGDLFDSLFNRRICFDNSRQTKLVNQTQFPFCHVGRRGNYRNSDGSIIVINKDQVRYNDVGIDSSVSHPINKATKIITRIFEKGIEVALQYDDSKRSGNGVTSEENSVTSTSTSSPSESGSSPEKSVASSSSSSLGKKKDKVREPGGDFVFTHVKENTLPQVNVGWTNQDCNAYADNYCTIAGNIKPCLKRGEVPDGVLPDLLELAELALSFFPKTNAFDTSKLLPKHGPKYREEMFGEFKSFLGGDSSDIKNFRVEGITVLVPTSVGWHRDTLNDNRPGFKSVISLNVNIKMNNSTLPVGRDSYFGTWLTKNGYHDHFPCSVILYSRDTVGGYCERMGKTDIFGERDVLSRLLKIGIVDRVGDVVDYRNAVFHNNMFWKVFEKKAKKKKKKDDANFKGLMWARTASYDRTVSLFVSSQLKYYEIRANILNYTGFVCLFRLCIPRSSCELFENGLQKYD